MNFKMPLRINDPMPLKIDEAHQELRHLREMLKKTQEILNHCEGVLHFYSNITNYGVSAVGIQSGITYQNALKDDFEQADNDSKTVIAGHKAREYFKLRAKD